MLKFSLRQKRVDFMNGWSISEHDMQETVDNEPDLLAMVPADASNKKSLDNVLSAIRVLHGYTTGTYISTTVPITTDTIPISSTGIKLCRTYTVSHLNRTIVQCCILTVVLSVPTVKFYMPQLKSVTTVQILLVTSFHSSSFPLLLWWS